MARIKVKVDRGNGLTQVITVDTAATQGARLGTDVFLPNGQVATPQTFLQWLGTAPSGGSGGSGSGGVPVGNILTTKGDLLTRDAQVQRLGIGNANDVLAVVAGMPAWSQAITPTWTGLHKFAASLQVQQTGAGDYGISAIEDPDTGLRWFGSGSIGVWSDDLPTALFEYVSGTATFNVGNFSSSQDGHIIVGGSGTGIGRVSGGGGELRVEGSNLRLRTTGGSSYVAVEPVGTETFRFAAAGQLGIGGATYGTAGQPFLSGGPSAPPTYGTLGAPAGGTGFGSYTAGDLLYANSTTTLAKLGIGTAGYVLRVSGGAPAWQDVSTFLPVGANPAAQVGLTAVNGVATTFLRSDGAPALDQGIAPTWTGTHRFASSSVTFTSTDVGVYPFAAGSGTLPAILWNVGGASSGARAWLVYATSTQFTIDARADDLSTARAAFEFVRSGAAITGLNFGNSTDNPPHSFFGDVRLNSNAASVGAGILSVGKGTAGSATNGSNVMPTLAQGFLVWNLGGTTIKIPYFNN